MGSFQSTQHDRESVDDGGGGETTRQEHETDVGSSSSDMFDGESCATIGRKSEGHAINNETPNESRKPSEDSSPDGFESCDGSEKCRELAEFREELGKKRELRKSKMADIKREMDKLRQDLAEEKAKNRALIRFIQQNQEQTKGASEVTTSGVEEITFSVNEATESCHNDTENHTEQSNSSPNCSTTTPPAQDDLRLGLKCDLAESQLQLQEANSQILSLQSVIDQLRTQIQTLQTPSEEEEAARTARNKEFRHLQAELADSQFQLQIANAEVLSLQTDITQLKNQIKGLKDVIKAGKEIIHIREDQVEQLKAKLRQIEDSLHEREVQIMSTDLRREYERQMANIRNLRELYEERERVSRMERDNLLRQLELRKNDLEAEQEKNKNLESHVASLQTDLETMKNELVQTQEKLSQSTLESEQLHAEMTVVNQFISKFLLGMNRKQTTNSVKLDKLTEVLAENRGLLIDMTKEESETIDLGAFLPRALYDLVAEVDEESAATDESECSEEDGAFNEVQTASPEQIADKLPKVWRVLIELVNHQERVQQVPFVENGESEECLKTEPTKNGSKTVVSVSKTYLKLKDLILEKKALKKETNRLKTLNTHLERRLETQEKRLSAVSLELTKTWHLVGKMQRQHRQLHTQEQILRYHLQQKRRLLSELKEELEYCRLKWSAARQKNIESEDQWKTLKADFAARKKQDSSNNSGESGYSDEQPTDDEDEDYLHGDKPSKKHLSRMINFERCRSSSLTNVLQVALELRKCYSESDMKSLHNVERANQFCNEKIEDLPIFPEEMVCPVKKKAKKPKKKKDKRSGPETAEDMFRRLAGLDQDTNEEEDDDDEEDDQDEISDDSECSEIEKIEQRESSPPKEPEMSSEELFNMKREARLKRMAELNSRLDTYSNPSSVKDVVSGISEEDQVEAGPSRVLTSTEEDYLQRRAARLERLEREAREFRNKLSRTVNRGSAISAQIDEIHNGFIARQSESPIPGSSSENRSATAKSNDVPPTDLTVLSDREREYTQNRSDRLQSLEDQSQALLQQMNRALKRGSRLTTQLDMLHSRYSSSDQNNASTSAEATASDQPCASTSPVQNVEENLLPEPETIDTLLLENSIVIPANGPLELILISDEEILEEVDELLPTPSSATSTQENQHEDNDRDSQS
ncbi:AAEL012556-PA [Aedes aegypti]|uniref:AAEL012556-PA n=2 Tax=Aedes aegypti TaxID=7159 RepID=A0A1S4FWG3_AEDAE|nr:myosin heavy chain, striated muscle [Aedes aegypti]EAT35266.1 AAEL012556-PA [Aedes aegypti]